MLPDFLRFWGANPAGAEALPYLIGVFIAAYLLGAIPFGMIISKIMGLGNLREIGSGNIGATNVLRTGSKSAAAATLVLDIAKGIIAVVIARYLYGEDAAQVAALGAFIGHLFPVYLMFRGGKGVAVFLGVMLALNLAVGLALCVIWLGAAYGFKYSSLAALIAAVTAPHLLYILGDYPAVWLGIVFMVLIWARHWKNIQRLARNVEPKIGQK